MQRRNIDIPAIRFMHRLGPGRFEAGDKGCRLRPVPALQVYVAPGEIGQKLVDQMPLLFPRNIDRTASAQETGFGKCCRRLFQKCERSGREGLHQRPAIAFGPESRRAAGRVIAREFFGLEHEHRSIGTNFRGDAGSGNTGPDDGDVKIFHRLGATRARKAKQLRSAALRTASTSRNISWADSGPNSFISALGKSRTARSIVA